MKHCQHIPCGKEIPSEKPATTKFCDPQCQARARQVREYDRLRVGRSNICKLEDCDNELPEGCMATKYYCSPDCADIAKDRYKEERNAQAQAWGDPEGTWYKAIQRAKYPQDCYRWKELRT